MEMLPQLQYFSNPNKKLKISIIFSIWGIGQPDKQYRRICGFLPADNFSNPLCSGALSNYNTKYAKRGLKRITAGREEQINRKL